MGPTSMVRDNIDDFVFCVSSVRAQVYSMLCQNEWCYSDSQSHQKVFQQELKVGEEEAEDVCHPE